MGTGYVGLPLAIFLARSGFRVVGVDVKKEVVDSINRGELPTSEPQLDRIFREPRVRRNLSASLAVPEADVFVLCVPTPLDAARKRADLTAVRAAVNSILPRLRRGNLVILESTVPPLTCRNVLTPMIEAGTGLRVNEDVGLVHCPERVFPGNLAEEIVKDDRVIGSLSKGAAERASAIYRTFVKGHIVLTDDVTAEFVKLIENSYRDVNIAFANELARLSEELGINVRQAIEIANAHPRVHIHQPGIGVGGHCIPIVPWFLAELDETGTPLIQTARAINDAMPARTAEAIRRAVADVADPDIVLVGMSYKPNVADTRESPALRVAEILQGVGLRVHQYDPLIPGHGYRSLADAARGADVLAVLVAHPTVVDDLRAHGKKIRASMRHPRILTF